MAHLILFYLKSAFLSLYFKDINDFFDNLYPFSQKNTQQVYLPGATLLIFY